MKNGVNPLRGKRKGIPPMSERLDWMLPSFEAGRIGSIHIRISLFFLALLPVFIIRLGWVLGSVIMAILAISVLLHEFGHVCLARWTGGSASEIHLSPIGGL